MHPTAYSADPPTQYATDEEIIRFLHQGDRLALAYIFYQHHITLFYFAMQFTGDATLAQNMVESCFTRLWVQRRKVRDLPAVTSFLYAEIKNACAYHAGRKDFDSVAQCILMKGEVLQRIWQDVEQLPPLRKKIVKMICLEDRTIFDIASELDISVDTVRVQKAKAMHTIRKLKTNGDTR